jgi:hypothetical protein
VRPYIGGPIASAAVLWNSERVPARSHCRYFMRFESPTIRLVMKAATAALLSLLAVSAGEASMAPRHAHRAAVCDSQGPTLRKLTRQQKAIGGPVARNRRARGGLLFDLAARLHRTVRVQLADDDDAIQNDGAAAGVDPDDRASPGLRPLGRVIGSLHKRPRTRAFSPRSPRGPPTPA